MMRRLLIGAITSLALLCIPASVFAGATSTAFPTKTIPYKGDNGSTAATNFWGSASSPGYMFSLDAAMAGVSGASVYDSSESAVYSGLKVKAGVLNVDVTSDFALTVVLNGPLDADDTADFATTVVVNGQLQTVGELEVDGVLDADATADFEGTVVINGELQTTSNINADGTADFATTVAFQGALDVNSTVDFATTLALPGTWAYIDAGTFVGQHYAYNGTTSPGQVVFFEDADNGTESIQIIAPSSVTASAVITLSQDTFTLRGPSYGALYAEDMTATVNTADTYTQIASYAGTIIEAGSGYVVSSSTGGTFTIGANGAGDYQVNASASFTAGAGNVVHCALHIDGTEQSASEFERKLSAGNDVGAAGLTGIVTLAASEVVDLMCKNNGVGGVDIVFNHLSFNINRVN